MSSSPQSIIVCCRFRPPNKAEKQSGSTNVLSIQENKIVSINMPGSTGKPVQFGFDHVFSWESSQEEVFEYTAKPLVQEVFNGYNTTIFAYGQTGSGKTHTMMGQPQTAHRGIIPRLAEAIFEGIEDSEVGLEFTVKLSYVEIYNEKIRDLLCPSKDNLRIREGSRGVWIEDVTESYVGDNHQVLDIMTQGQNNRAIAATNMNMESSRSHSVFILTVGQRNTKTGAKKGSKLILVDLAGSEKVAKTGAAGSVLKEAQHINRSLSALGNVINALTSGGKHVPYRDSKLTRLLSDSLGGNSKTCLIITGSPSSDNADETLSTLRFGTRAKSIKNKPVVNQEKSVQEYQRLLALADNKVNAQNSIIRLLEKDVLELRNCLAAVDPSHLKVPIPPFTPRKLGLPMPSEDEDEKSPVNATSPSLASPSPSAFSSEPPMSPSYASPLRPDMASPSITSPSVSFASPSVTSPLPSKMLSLEFDKEAEGDADAEEAESKDEDEEAEGLQELPSPMSRSLQSLSMRSDAMVASNAQLLNRLEEADKERKDLREQLHDKERELEEQSLVYQNDTERLQSQVNELKAKQEDLENKAVQWQELLSEYNLLKNKLEMVEKEHILQVSQWQDERATITGEIEKEKKKAALAVEQAMKVKADAEAEQQRHAEALKEKQETQSNEQLVALERQKSRLAKATMAAVAQAQAQKGTVQASHMRTSSTSSEAEEAMRELLTEEVASLNEALQKKCDQFIHLQLAHHKMKERMMLMETALEAATKRLKEQNSQKKIKTLETKLANAEALCKKLLETGMYWRQQRQKEASGKIVVPLQGGGGRQKQASSSIASSASSSSTSTSSTRSEERKDTSGLPRAAPRPTGDSMDMFF